MKIWFTLIAIVSVVAVASAGTLTSNMDASKGGDKGHGGKGGGKECVPEPLTMLALAPGAAMLLRKRKQK